MAESHFNYALLSLTVLHDGGRQMNDRIETNTALLLQITGTSKLRCIATHRAAVDTLNYVRLLEARGRRQTWRRGSRLCKQHGAWPGGNNPVLWD